MRRTKAAPTTHLVCSALATRLTRISLVGVGGNGCRMLHGLAQLHIGLKALGHPGGLHVTSYDADIVSRANVGRTVFGMSDVGMHKSIVLTNRINNAYGLDFDAVPTGYDFEQIRKMRWDQVSQILITCVDSAAARRGIYNAMNATAYHPEYWLDLGNSQATGQVVMGEMRERDYKIGSGNIKSKAKAPPRLPHVVDLFPELLNESIPEDNRPSCSLQEAIASQDLFVNQAVSSFALQLLWELFRNATISRHGYFINLESGCVKPLTVESSFRACFGGKG